MVVFFVCFFLILPVRSGRTRLRSVPVGGVATPRGGRALRAGGPAGARRLRGGLQRRRDAARDPPAAAGRTLLPAHRPHPTQREFSFGLFLKLFTNPLSNHFKFHRQLRVRTTFVPGFMISGNAVLEIKLLVGFLSFFCYKCNVVQSWIPVMRINYVRHEERLAK